MTYTSDICLSFLPGPQPVPVHPPSKIFLPGVTSSPRGPPLGPSNAQNPLTRVGSFRGWESEYKISRSGQVRDPTPTLSNSDKTSDSPVVPKCCSSSPPTPEVPCSRHDRDWVTLPQTLPSPRVSLVARHPCTTTPTRPPPDRCPCPSAVSYLVECRSRPRRTHGPCPGTSSPFTIPLENPVDPSDL